MRTSPGIAMLLMLATIIAVPGALAGEKAPDPEVPATEVEDQKPKPERRPTAPAKTFTPTEKIKADSSVSFPVDI